MAKTVVGSFENYSEAQRVITELVQRGFDREDISILAKKDSLTGDRSDSNIEETTEGAAKGALTGGVLGGAAGVAAGLAGLAIPGIGPVIAAGPIAAGLAGAGVGAVAGGAIGALTKLGVDDDDAEYYAESIRRGGALVVVHADDDRAEQAADILQNFGAIDIDRRAEEWRQSGWQRFSDDALTDSASASTSYSSTASSSYDDDLSASREAVIPVIEEHLKVGKRLVQKGGVNVYSHIVEQPVHEQVSLREEHVHVERRPVDRPLTDADLQQALQDRSIEMTETAEEAVIQKEARVVEEVVINKEATERTETIEETVRHTEVEVDEELVEDDLRNSTFARSNRSDQSLRH